MKRLFFFLTCLIPFWLLAQSPYNIQGYITDINTSAPIANHAVTITSNTPSFPYTNTVTTNMMGFYSDVITVPATVPQIVFLVTTSDCNGNTMAYTLVYFNSSPNPAIADFQVCGGTLGGCQAYFTYSANAGTISFQNQSQGGNSYNWDFGNGQTSSATNPTNTYTQSGSYSVCLTVFDSVSACIDTYCDTIVVNVGGGGTGNCQANFVATVSANTVYFTNTSTGLGNTTTYYWDFGDGTTDNTSSPIHTYTLSGTYYVCLTITTVSSIGVTCTSMYCDYVIVGSGSGGCQAYFTYGVSGGTVSFQNQSQGGSYYNWDFGNGQTSSAANPTYTYTQSGSYLVCLTVYDSVTACQDTYCDTITVNTGGTSCQANFTTSTLSPNAIYFTNASTGLGSSTIYSWDFGDGTTDNTANPIHTYAQSGTYYVCLTITTVSSAGITCTSMYCDYVIVGSGTGGCQAYFTYSVNGGAVSFQNQSQGNGYTSSWNFGNGQTSFIQHPNYTYTQSGTYTVCLTIYDTTGCQSTYCDTIVINTGGTGNCQASFVATVSATGTAAFSSTSTGVNNTTSYLWNFGNGATSTAMNPTYTYPNPGTYFVCLTITTVSSAGTTCVDSSCQYITIGGISICQAYFTYSVNGGVVSFQNQSTPGGYFSNWNFGNGQTSSVQHPTQTYTQTGWYYVCLFIYDSTGCQSNYCDSIYVNVGGTGNCQANFVSTVNGNVVSFTNTSTGLGATTTYSWNFGDGTTSNLANPVHTYSQSGTYYVCLTIITVTSNGNTCTSNYCDYIIAGSGGGGNCQAYFTYGINGGTVSFQNQSTPSGYFSNWNFGNGQTSSVQHPTQTYTQTGWYYVCLFIYDSTGCQSTYCDSIYVNVGTASCQAAFNYTLSGNTVSFTNTSTGGTPNTMTYTWIFGNGNTSNAISPTQTYNVPGVYTVCLYIMNTQNGCTDTVCQIITIPNSTGNCAAAFTYQMNGTTGGISFGGIATGTAPYTYTWAFGDGTNAITQNPTHNYAQSGTYIVCLTITDAIGCTATHCDTLNMTVLGIDNAFVNNLSELYPNPTQANVAFDIELKAKTEIGVEVLNMIGQSIFTEKQIISAGSHQINILTNNLAQGMYMIRISAEGQMIDTKRLIKE